MKLFFFFLTLTLCACAPIGDKSNVATTGLDDTLIEIRPYKESEGMRFGTDESCVVFLLPSDSEIEELHKAYAEEDYNEIINDLTWYPGIASEYLDSLGIKSEIVDNHNALIFIMKSGKRIKWRKDEIKGDMILFRCDTIPIISNAIDFNREFARNFFRKNQ